MTGTTPMSVEDASFAFNGHAAKTSIDQNPATDNIPVEMASSEESLTTEKVEKTSESDTNDEWKKFAHYIPALYAAIEKNGDILVGEFLQIQPYAETTYDQLRLSVRAINCLDREKLEHKSITDLVLMPLARLAGMRNAGAKTVREILDALSEYARLNPRSSVDVSIPGAEVPEVSSAALSFLMPYADLIAEEKWDDIESYLKTEEQLDALLKVMDIAEVIGADMVAAALRSAYPVAVLLPSLIDFIKEQRACEVQTKKLKVMVDNLPDERKNLPIKPFAHAWPGKNVLSEFEDTFDDIVTFEDLLHQPARYSDEEFRLLESFLPWCGTSIAAEVTSVVDACFKNDKCREITLYRAQGKMLEEIGALYSLTRERIRQLEKKAICLLHIPKAESILLLISAVRRGDKILTAQEILDYCGDDGVLFLHFLRNAEGSKHYRYAKPLDAFILGNSHLEEEHVHSFVDELPDRIDEKELEKYLKQAAERGLPPELIELQIQTDYHFLESIHTWQRGKLSLRKMSREILPEFDPNGIHVTIPEELRLFREKLHVRFGSEIRISEGDHALIAIIADVGMLRDRGTYVSARDHILSADLLERIRDYVDQGENDVYMFSTLFEAFKPELLEVGVDNRYFLQGILKREWDQFYSFSRDCISKSGRITNIYGTVESFIKNAGRYVSVPEIKEAFPGVTDAVLNFALMQKRIIACNGKYIHAENLHLTEQHVQQLKQTLDMLLADGQAHHSRELFSLASTYNGSWLDEIGVMYQSALFSIAAYLYSSDCVFSRPWIAVKGSAGEETIRQLRGCAVATDDDEGESYTEPKLVYEGNLIDIVMTVLQKAAAEMTIQEITDEIIEKGLYQSTSQNPSLSVYQAINNAVTGKGSRNAALGRLLGMRIDSNGRRLYYLLDSNQPIFAEPCHKKIPDEKPMMQILQPAVDPETASRWNQILSEEFEDGLRLNGMRLRKFRNIYEERFHGAVEPDDEKLIELLKQVGEYRDERIYAKQEDGQSSLLATIQKDALDTLSAGASCVYPQQLFEKYRNELAQQLSVYTVEAFKSLLLASTNRQFSVSYGIICLPGKNPNVTLDAMNLFQESYEPITYSQIAERLWYIPFDRIKHELVTEKSIVRIEQETYFYAPNFPISTHELAALQRAMKRQIEDDGFMVARSLHDLMLIHCPNAGVDTASWKDRGIRNVMAWLLRDHFDFNGVVICAKGAGIDTHMVFRSYCKAHERVTMDELKDLCDQLDVSGIYWDSVLAEMVRVSRNEFLSKRLIAFDAEATDRVLEQACPGNYMPLKDFTLFMSLPGVAIPWNGFLLESYLRDYSRIFRLEQAGPVEHTPIGAMVRRMSPFRTNRDLLIDVLAHDDSWHSTKEALDVLVESGYRTQRLMANASEMIKAAQQKREKLKAEEK